MMKRAARKDFRDKVESLLAAQGMTKGDLYRRIGMTQSGLGNTLKTGNPTLSTLLRIADGLGVDPHELLPGEPKTLREEHSEEKCFRALGLDGRYRAVIALHNWLRSEGMDEAMDRIVLDVLRLARAPASIIEWWRRVLRGSVGAIPRSMRSQHSRRKAR